MPMPEVTGRDVQLKSRDGTSLHLFDLVPNGATRTLVLIHGYGEHGTRYVERIRPLVEAGWRVVLPDLRGHGRSDGDRGHVLRFDDYLADVDAVFDWLGTPPERTAILGHSNGGLVTACWLLANHARVRCAVLTSPLFGLSVQAPRWKTTAGRLLSRVAPRVSLPSEIRSDVLSHDPAQVRLYDTDPLIHHVANARWYTEALDAMTRVTAGAPTWQPRTLVLQAGDDRLVSAADVERVCRAMPTDRVEFDRIEGAFHELFFETDGPAHVARVANWLDAQLPASPP